MNAWIGEPVTLDEEGKTKKIFTFENRPALVRVFSKDDITAGDGKRHAILPGKGALATTTTVNVFRFLQRRAIPTAFLEQDSSRSFVAENCTMIPLEVIGRWKVDPKSSLLKRNPDLPVGELLEKPLIEFFLKTSGKRWHNRALPCDDPYLVLQSDSAAWGVYEPNKPITPENMLFSLLLDELDLELRDVHNITNRTTDVAMALRDMWDVLDCDLRDFKIEYGFPITKERLLVADVLDNDSWRLYWDGTDISKQPFRDGAPLDEVLHNYQRVAEFSNRFPL